MKEFKREPRYFVLKVKDMEKYLTENERNSLECIAEEVEVSRIDDGKQPLKCVIVEKDWPEYEPTWAAIKARMEEPKPTGEQKT